MATFTQWLKDQLLWKAYVENQGKHDSTLLRAVAQLDEYSVGIGKTGHYRLTYSFSAQVLALHCSK